jgi:hypothetical protein B2_16663
MYDKKQNIHYCTILSAEQWDFLLEGKFSTHRQKCLYKLMTDAVQVETSYKIKGVEIALEVGEVAASDVELAEYLGCNRKTIGKLVDSFNRLGMLTTRTNNRTSIHTLHFLTGWYVGGVLITNPHYVRPSATAKGQIGDVRTPDHDKAKSGSAQPFVRSGSQNPTQKVGSMEAEAASLSSSLCLSGTSSLPDNKPSVEEYPLPSELFTEDDNGLSVDLGGVGNLCGNNAVKSQEMAQGNRTDTVPDP